MWLLNIGDLVHDTASDFALGLPKHDLDWPPLRPLFRDNMMCIIPPAHITFPIMLSCLQNNWISLLHIYFCALLSKTVPLYCRYHYYIMSIFLFYSYFFLDVYRFSLLQFVKNKRELKKIKAFSE